MLPDMLARLGLPALLDLVGKGLGKIDNPIAKTAAEAVQQTADHFASGAISPEQVIEANRHIEELARIEASQTNTQISQINASLRTEVASNDWYVRRMRPTFGYIMAATWGAQMLALAYTIIARPSEAGGILNAMEGLGLIWSVGLSVLGIYVYKRSDEKRGR